MRTDIWWFAWSTGSLSISFETVRYTGSEESNTKCSSGRLAFCSIRWSLWGSGSFNSPKGVQLAGARGELTPALDVKPEHGREKIMILSLQYFQKDWVHSYRTSANWQVFTHLVTSRKQIKLRISVAFREFQFFLLVWRMHRYIHMVYACTYTYLNTQTRTYEKKCGANNEFNLAAFFFVLMRFSGMSMVNFRNTVYIKGTRGGILLVSW